MGLTESDVSSTAVTNSAFFSLAKDVIFALHVNCSNAERGDMKRVLSFSEWLTEAVICIQTLGDEERKTQTVK